MNRQTSCENADSALRKDHRESSDRYRGELFRDGGIRVVECRDGIQWLLQRCRGGKSPAGGAWRSIAFCTTRKALIRLLPAENNLLRENLAALPVRIGKGGV